MTHEAPAWETVLVQVFGHHQRRYGTRRLQVALRRKGHHVGRQRLRAAMRRRGLHALQPKAFTPRTTDATHGLRCAPNRLLDQPKPVQTNRVRVRDITCLPLANGDWAYRCAFQDVASKQVVGWQVGATMPEELVATALQRAFWAQSPPAGLLVHSDRGGQYGGKAYRALLHDQGAVRSQSRRGDCYDNAQAESRWSRLRTEVLELRERPVFADLADAQASELDFDGYVAFESKTKRGARYQPSRGPTQLRGTRRYRGSPAATKRVNRYFPDYFPSRPMATAAPRRKLGVEPPGVDFVVHSPVLTEADWQEMSAFFRRKRAQNDRSPTVLALRRQIAARK